jgi:ubiquinone/menaquinone biosynthesis C-methylase UbiE
MAHGPDSFIPALGRGRLTPLYDPLVRWFMREAKFKRRLLEQARVRKGDRVLDVGCGTGTLAVMVREGEPGAEVVGLDGDAKVLGIARGKAAKAGVDLLLEQGMSYQMPYQDNTFDRVLSSLMLHHLSYEDKRRTLREAFRVLRPGGELHVVDFGPPRGAYSRLVALVTARMEQAADNIEGLLPGMFREAGFQSVEETDYLTTVAGVLSFYRGVKA